MPVHPTSQLYTADELLRTRVPGKVTELWRGQLVVREPPGTLHGSVAARLTYLLADHVYRHQLGVVCSQDTGFRIYTDPDTVRAPDVSFVDRARAAEIPAIGYAPFAPDLAAEILSPDDRAGDVLSKVGQWLDAGSRLVWVIDPLRRNGRMYHDTGDLVLVNANGNLDGEPVIAGFRCSLAEMLR